MHLVQRRGKRFRLHCEPARRARRRHGARYPVAGSQLPPPHTAKKIIRPQLRSRQPTECGKHFVAGMVPVPIVDALEAIEIKHDEGRRLATQNPSRYPPMSPPPKNPAGGGDASKWTSKGAPPIACGNPILGEASE